MLNFSPYLDALPNIIYAFVLALALTPLLRKIGLKYGFSTKPAGETNPEERGFVTKHHTKTMPRLGEFAMLVPLFLLMWKDLNLTTQLLGITLAIGMIGIFGAFDSKYNISEFVKIYILFFAGIILIFTGTVIDLHSILPFSFTDFYITNPITQSNLSVFSALFTLTWLYIIPTALSYLGGVDGLSEGTSAIAIMILTLIGIRNGDVMTITIGALCLGGLIGLLPYNFHPAVIFSEHLVYGYIIAILAITSNTKIATSILILTVPIIDFIYVTSVRIGKCFKENKRPSLRLILHYMGTGDRNHIHHKLMELGFKPMNISLVMYALYALLGFVAVAVSDLYLTFAILSSIVIIVLIFYYVHRRIRLKNHG